MKNQMTIEEKQTIHSAELLRLELTACSGRNYLHAAKKALSKAMKRTVGLQSVEIRDMSKPLHEEKGKLYRVRVHIVYQNMDVSVTG